MQPTIIQITAVSKSSGNNMPDTLHILGLSQDGKVYQWGNGAWQLWTA